LHYDTYQIAWYDIRVPNGYLTFNFNSDREINGFDIDQPNLLDVDFGELNIKRLKEDNPIKPIVVDDKILESYVGEYEVSSDLIITISKTGKQLKTQMTGQSEIFIIPILINVFKVQDTERKFVFNRTNDGKVESLTLIQGEQQYTFKRIKN
jgi:hypothetical protein